MTEEQDDKLSTAVFNSLLAMLDERKWHYDKNDEDLTVACSAQGEDLPIDLNIRVDKKRKLVVLLSAMPFAVPKERRAALAVAVSCAGSGLIDGSFDYDYLSGRILFRMTSCYRESLIGKDLFSYMLMCACYTIDEYNDKFLMVAKSDMTFDEIIQFIK